MDCYQRQIYDSVSHTWHQVRREESHALVRAFSEEVNKLVVKRHARVAAYEAMKLTSL